MISLDQSEVNIQVDQSEASIHLASAEDREAHGLAPVGHRLWAAHAVVQLYLHP